VSKAEQLFHAGDLVGAENLAAAALKQNPNDPQAGYLMRVIEREKQSPPATNP
jgi:hypothetical protein